MRITVKAATAWDKVAHEQAGDDEAAQVARSFVMGDILKQIAEGKKPTFEDEVQKLVRCTMHDAGTRDLFLHQVMGVAEQQGYDASRHVDALITKLDI